MLRKTIAAGRFYTDEPENLKKEVTAFLQKGAKPSGRCVGLLVPHAGYEYSGAAAGTALACLKTADIDTLVILATGHTMGLDKGALLAEGSFDTPLGPVEIDEDFCRELLKEKKLFTNSPHAHAGEHAVEVQLPFLRVLKGASVKIVPILFNTPDAALLEEAGRAIGRAMKGRRAMFCVSSDLSHYPPAKIAEMSDRSVLLSLRQAMRNSNPGYFHLANSLLLAKAPSLDTTACGQAAMTAGAAAALELGANDFELSRYNHSGDVSGDDSAVVGYGAGFFTEVSPKPAGGLELGAKLKTELLTLARRSISHCLRAGEAAEQPLSATPEFNQPAAVFVTLTIGGELRGCIGSLEPRGTLCDMVGAYACAAAFEDPRFGQVMETELAKIKIEISVLSPLKPAGPEDVKKGAGVYVKCGSRSGTYLPQVWEHFKNKEDFMSSLCLEKAGLEAGAWKEKSTALYVYAVDCFSE